MQIDFKALEQALAPIAQIGQGELTFDVGNTSITVRVLRPSEEVEAQKYAGVSLEGDGPSSTTMVEYVDRFRIACLAHAIVAVGPKDFRDVDYVTTGENLPNGVAVKIPKHKAMRDLLSTWTRATLGVVFTKFSELVQKTEIEAEKAVVFEPADIPSEIERLQQRIEELKGEVEKSKALDRSKFTDILDAMQPPAPAPEQEVAPSRAPITPKVAAPPVEPAKAPQIQPPALPAQPQSPPAQTDFSTFIDLEDESGSSAAMEAETQRLLQRRQNRGPQPDEGSALNQVRRRAPHFDALDVEEDIGVLKERASYAREVGVSADGVPVFALPSQELDKPSTRGKIPPSALNPEVRSSTSLNPRFQNPHKP